MRLFALLVFFFEIGFSEVVDLSLYEKSVFTQNGEDGVLAKIFNVIGIDSKVCVEFGAGDGYSGSNTCFLRNQGWEALLLDRLCDVPEMNLHKEFVTKDNINTLFEKYEVPHHLDLLSIDIDFNDFHVWRALDPKFEAKVVVIECNATHLPDVDKVVPSRPLFSGDGTNYFGASILALYNLGRAKGYSLIYHESTGANLFFIRDSVLEKTDIQFKYMNDVEKLYKAPKYGMGPNGGHSADIKNRPYKASKDFL